MTGIQSEYSLMLQFLISSYRIKHLNEIRNYLCLFINYSLLFKAAKFEQVAFERLLTNKSAENYC